MNDAVITEREKFTAATQLVFLYILYSEKTEFDTDELAKSLDDIPEKAQALAKGLPEIQIMQYDIGRLTKNQYVDPISLIMGITRKDDRTEIAIDELMEGAEWYEE